MIQDIPASLLWYARLPRTNELYVRVNFHGYQAVVMGYRGRPPNFSKRPV